MSCDSDEAEDIQNQWLSAMYAGDFEAAWQQTDRIESRRRSPARREQLRGILRWDGLPFEGRRVLIRCLHGLGDTLQFARFVPRVHRLAAHSVFAVQPALVPLISADDRFGAVVNGWCDDPFPGHEVEIEIMELAYAFRATTHTLPIPPYLHAGAIQRNSSWAPPASHRRPRIGLLWKSSTYDPTRSLHPGALAHLGANVSFYSLQQDAAAAELGGIPLCITDLASRTREIVDAAKAMLWLDLIITVDGMPAHLAGALNRAVWVLLKQDADWRWMRDRSDSPWYPSMRLFRQNRKDDWESVLREVGAELKSHSSFTGKAW
jgi:hypothetical protein